MRRTALPFIALLALGLPGGAALANTAEQAQLVTVPLAGVPGAVQTQGPVRLPSINEGLLEIQRAQQAPVSEVPGMEIGDPVPVYRTLGDAATAGVNPMAKPAGPTITASNVDDVGEEFPLWTVVLGGASAILAGFLIAVAILSRKSGTPR